MRAQLQLSEIASVTPAYVYYAEDNTSQKRLKDDAPLSRFVRRYHYRSNPLPSTAESTSLGVAQSILENRKWQDVKELQVVVLRWQVYVIRQQR